LTGGRQTGRRQTDWQEEDRLAVGIQADKRQMQNVDKLAYDRASHVCKKGCIRFRIVAYRVSGNAYKCSGNST
jgi:hypothetical protein